MTLTIGTWTYSGNAYTAQPFGYEEVDVRLGHTAKKCRVGAMLTAAEWQALLGVYDTWRDLRIQDPDSKTSNSVGTTVAVTMAANGISWTAVPCWFITAPQGEQLGAFVQATVELVDAAQSLALLHQQELLSKARYHFGTWTIGTTVVQLLRPPEAYQDAPAMALTAGGHSYITGPLTATRVRQIEGDTDAAGWAAIQSWYETTIATAPSVGDWWPVSAPIPCPSHWGRRTDGDD
jgi:hypothetical protein